MTREKYIKTHVMQKKGVPPLGYYYPLHKAIDPDVRAPEYGETS